VEADCRLVSKARLIAAQAKAREPERKAVDKQTADGKNCIKRITNKRH
jgi:hypothetical protein